MGFPVFRAYSPDGLTEMRLLPTFSWSFHPAIGMKTVAGCLPIQQTLGRRGFWIISSNLSRAAFT